MNEADEFIRKLLAKALADPLSAADDLEAMAAKLMGAARDLRNRPVDPFQVPGGMVDRVKIGVVGPDGQQKEYKETT